MAAVKPEYEEAPQGHDTRVAFLLSQLGFVVSRRFHETLAPLGLEPRQFLLMRLLAENEGTSQQALGEKLSIPASRMVALLDDLEERHLLERRPNPTDRRARALHLTDKGRQLLANTLGAAVRYEQEIAAPLTMDERAQLAQLLRRLAVHHHLVIDVHPALTLDDERCRS